MHAATYDPSESALTDPQAFRQAVVEVLPRLRRFARTITAHPADADDLVQLTVERALRRWQQWQAGSRLDSWMFGIMRNAWIDELRSRQRRARIFLPEEAGEQIGDCSGEQQQQALAIRQALDGLPDDQRLAVGLVLIEGLSYQEAATALGIPVGTLTSRLSRARAALIGSLGGNDEDQR